MNPWVGRYRQLVDPLRTERQVELLLLGLVLILSVQVVWGCFRLVYPALPVPLQPAPDALQALTAPGLAVVSEQDRAEIRDRPLFWLSRRPALSVEAPAQDPKRDEAAATPLRKIDGVTLTGVFGSEDYAGIIVVAKGREQRIALGEQLNGWYLESITATGAMFTSGGKTAELSLRRGQPKAVLGDEASAAAPVPGIPGDGGAQLRTGQGESTRREASDSLGLGGDSYTGRKQRSTNK